MCVNCCDNIIKRCRCLFIVFNTKCSLTQISSHDIKNIYIILRAKPLNPSINNLFNGLRCRNDYKLHADG